MVDTAGVASEFANAESKAVRNVKRSIESAFCSSQDRQADAGAGAPYKTRGMLKWLGVGGQPSDVPAFAQNVANDTTGTQTEQTTEFNSCSSRTLRSKRNARWTVDITCRPKSQEGDQ